MVALAGSLCPCGVRGWPTGTSNILFLPATPVDFHGGSCRNLQVAELLRRVSTHDFMVNCHGAYCLVVAGIDCSPWIRCVSRNYRSTTPLYESAAWYDCPLFLVCHDEQPTHRIAAWFDHVDYAWCTLDIITNTLYFRDFNCIWNLYKSNIIKLVYPT